MIQIYSPTNTNYDVNGDAVLLPTVCEIDTDTWQLTIEHPRDPEGRWKLIEDGAVLKVPSFLEDDQLFRIFNTDKDESGVSATAQPIFFDSKNDCMLLDVRPTDKNGQQTLDIMTQGTKYSGSSDITSLSTAYYVMKNLMEALTSDDENSFLNRWGGEVLYNNYEVIINEKIGSDHGVQLLYGKNIPENGMSVEIDSSEVVTRIYPKAYNGRMMSNNGYVDSDNIDNYPTVKQAVMEFSDVRLAEDVQAGEDTEGMIICNTQTELDSALQTKCEEQYEAGIDTPNVSIKCDMVLLANTVNYADIKELETVSQGDTVYCKNQLLGVTTTARVQSLVYDCILDCVKSVVIGSKPYNYIDNTSSTISAADKVIDKGNNTLMADRIAGIINLMNTSLRAQKSVAQKQDVRAILFEDLDEESPMFGALCLGTQGLQISKERNESNTDWVWGTAINFESIIADYIITGILSDKLGKNSWNLDTGVLTTKDIVVENGTFSGNISGSTITGGNINGTAITGGSISSNTEINVSTDLRVGNNVYVGQDQSAGSSAQKYIYFSEDSYLRKWATATWEQVLLTGLDVITVRAGYNKNMDGIANLTFTTLSGVPTANLNGGYSELFLSNNESRLYGNNGIWVQNWKFNGLNMTEIYDAINSGNRVGWIGYNGTNTLNLNNDRNSYLCLQQSSSNIMIGPEGIYPENDGARSCGWPTKRWNTIYAQSGSINTSDRNVKKDILEIDRRYLEMFKLLKPIQFRFKEGTSNRIHLGFISQDVKETMDEVGLTDMEFAGYCRDIKRDQDSISGEWHDVLDDDGNQQYIYSLRYDEFIALNTRMIQECLNKIERLEERIAFLEEAMKK